MFEMSLAPAAGTRRRLTLPLALVAHGVVLAVLILLPLFYTEAIGRTELVAFLAVPEVPAPPSAPPDASVERASPSSPAPAIDPEAMIAPAEIPRDIAFVVDTPRASVPGLPAGTAPPGGEVLRRLFGQTPRPAGEPPAPPLPPPPPPPAMPVVPLRLTGGVVEGYLLVQPPLEYPVLARDSRIEGAVVLEAVISDEGRIRPESIRVVTGHSILARAAAAAILEWEYQPYLLNGQPIEVITTITVRYWLGGAR